MVEAGGEPHVVLVTPPSMFDAAVVLRTLYAGLGPRGWRLTLIGMGSRVPARLVMDARVPVEVVRGNVVTEPAEPPGPLYLVDPRGERAAGLEPPGTLVVDYTGSARLGEARRVSCLGLPSLTYEAVACIYEFWIRRLRLVPSEQPSARDPRQCLYLARKLLEAVSSVDDYTVLAPNVVAYTLRRVYMSRGLILDPAATSIEIDHASGSVREVIRAKLYRRRGLAEAGEVVVTYRDGVVEVRDPWGLAYRIALDPVRGRACCSGGLCAEASRGGPPHA